MTQVAYGEGYGGNAPENYERYFVPAIGRPAATGLVAAAQLRPGERVLDVACGTGIVARLAAEQVAPGGHVTGLDVNPGMIAVARASAPPEASIEWHQAPAEHMPLEDGSFDVVLCGMGLQFFSDREAGLREMYRVLVPGGRAVLNLPGPIPRVFSVFEEALTRNLGPEAAGFASLVFSLHEPDEIRSLVRAAGFDEIRIASDTGVLRVPPPKQFMWQYIHATPLAGALAGAGEERRAALERDVLSGWEDYVEGGNLMLEVRMTTVVATK
jgi:ubiquinone/menaquinone biosynthesis C-methylase UbiE